MKTRTKKGIAPMLDYLTNNKTVKKYPIVIMIVAIIFIYLLSTILFDWSNLIEMIVISVIVYFILVYAYQMYYKTKLNQNTTFGILGISGVIGIIIGVIWR